LKSPTPKSNQHYNTYEKDGRIFIKVHTIRVQTEKGFQAFRNPQPLGYIDPKLLLLVVSNKDNLKTWDGKHPHLGLDICILEAMLLDYHFITFLYKGRELTTTRSFFKRNAVESDLFNGRNMLFLDINKFNLSRAVRADLDSELSVQQLDLFDTTNFVRKGDSRLLSIWMKLQEKAHKQSNKEQPQSSQIKKKEIKL
jgi:hypothetical protein